MARPRIALAQIDTCVGDLDANIETVLTWSRRAADAGAHLVVFPEMTLTGYPIEDLALRASFRRGAQAALEKLATLKPAFKPGGNVTPGNASGINDGAATVVLATASKAAELGLKPLARVVSWGVAGVKGEHMGIGPVPAIRLALSRANMTLEQMDLIEINEAFAGQFLACAKELALDVEKSNVHGGAIALGHPIGASGARILLTLAYELAARGGRYGVASACIGGGQGIAMVIERIG